MNCLFCGAEEKPFSSNPEDHCMWVGEYAHKLKGVRSPYCYERELARKDALLGKRDDLLQEVLMFYQFWCGKDPYNSKEIGRDAAHSLEHLTIKIQALLADMEKK